MANYYGASRTNYFKVKDYNAFINDIEKISFSTDIEIFESDLMKGKTVALGGYDDICLAYDSEAAEEVYVPSLIQKHIADDDACIIMVSGHEKLRFVTAYSVVVTSNEIRVLDVIDMGLDAAAEMLGLDKFKTQLFY